ncbi:MAG: hypothetical protein QOG69_3056 [Actinomycetota bacterium]|jgi:hypothetical protein|nr:hypothetical protein [Actinomycetota bacterium]
MSQGVWTIEFHAECEKWADGLVQRDKEALLAAISVLRDVGPALGRPLVDTVVASRHANMKELRPGSTGRTEIRVLFAFDKARTAVLLVGGDKSIGWKGWYATNIPIADELLDAHQRSLDERATRARPSSRGGRQRKGGKRS